MTKIKKILLVFLLALSAVTLIACNKVKSVEVDGPEEVVAGETAQYTASVLPKKADQEVTWTVSDEDMASIDEEGKITTVESAVGKLEVIATSVKDPSKSGKLEVEILPYNKVIRVDINGPLVVEVGKTANYTATIYPVAAPQEVTWSVDKTDVATINVETGVLTGVAYGIVLVKATSVDDPTKVVEQKVVVASLSEEIAVGQNLNLAEKLGLEGAYTIESDNDEAVLVFSTSEILGLAEGASAVTVKVAGEVEYFVAVTVKAAAAAVGQYTYKAYASATPTDWNDHTWQNSADRLILAYTTSGFFDQFIELDENKQAVYKENGFVQLTWKPAAATDMPIDITDSLTSSQKAAYNVPDSATGGYAYQFNIRDNLKWQDGTPIVAQDFVESMELKLNPYRANYRANSHYNREANIAGAKEYFLGGYPIYEQVGDYDEDEDFDFYEGLEEEDFRWFSPTAHLNFWEASLQWYAEEYPGYVASYLGALLNNYRRYANRFGYVDLLSLDADVLEQWHVDAKRFAQLFGLHLVPDIWKTMTCSWDGESYYEIPNFDETVGIYAKSDYQLVVVFAQPMIMNNVVMFSDGSWLVKADLYRDLTVEVGNDGKLETKYGSSVDTTFSWGPFNLVSFQQNKEYVLEKNEHWYGYGLPVFEEQWQVTRIVTTIIPNPSTAKMMFLSGLLDEYSLQPVEAPEYFYSSNIQGYSTTYSMRIYLNSDAAKLQAIEEKNPTTTSRLDFLANYSFRKALSWAMNRAELIKTLGGVTTSFVLLNEQYFYDAENDLQFRKHEETMKALVSLYGLKYGPGEIYETLSEAYFSITGYDLQLAKQLFQEAFDEVTTIKPWAANDKVEFRITIGTGRTAEYADLLKYLQSALTTAVQGTSLEGKLFVTMIETPPGGNRYTEGDSGNNEAFIGAMGGASYFPFAILVVNVGLEPAYPNAMAYGSDFFVPLTLNLNRFASQTNNAVDEDLKGTNQILIDNLLASISPDAYDEETGDITLTHQEWVFHLNNEGELFYASYDLQCYIGGWVEAGILNLYNEIPLWNDGSSMLYSKKLKYLLDFEDIKVAYGGIQYIKFLMDDAQWNEFIRDKNNLDYTK